MLGKQSNLSYYDVRERYEHFRSRCTEDKSKVKIDKSHVKIFTFKKQLTRKKKEKGCTEPLYGKKAKCVINIVPQENKIATFQIDEKCVKTKG
jgi:hypothetical protein